ncbi:hypothetical protein [Microbacterium caowuchunii]|uniref:hypothetical protein n=1 Tax=Microbacterium caowuchunii TaxID=2614638 RepID=UPI00177E130D|nr:hypothetical protein [Microbacterium caowuchunii]
MNLLDALRGLIRRWYIVVPGLVLAAAASIFVWIDTPPDYERSASLLLLPGQGVLPEGATNQYLYMGGLGPVADVVTRAVGGEGLVQAYREDGAEIDIARDASGTGPLMVVTVRATSERAAVDILDAVAEQAVVTLDQLQAEQGVRPADRVTMTTIAVAQESEILQRSRLVATGTIGLGVALVTLILASVIDGVLIRRRRPRRGKGEEPSGTLAPEDDPDQDADGDDDDPRLLGDERGDEWAPMWADEDRHERPRPDSRSSEATTRQRVPEPAGRVDDRP